MTDILDFTPHPGSRRDATAAQQAAEQPIAGIAVAEAAGAPMAVPVREEPPSRGFPQVVLLTSATPVAPLLPQDTTRRGAVVLAVDNDVYLCASREAGQAVSGTTTGTIAFYLPAGIGIPVSSTAAMWVASTTSATSSRVSVLVTKDDG